MKYFNLRPVIQRLDSFAEIASQFNLSRDDLILTHEFIYEPFMKALGLEATFIFQEKYGAGEPSDEMADAILAEIKGRAFKRVVAVGGGTVIDISKLCALKDIEHVVDVLEKRVPIVKDKELIIVPTTCGTGSEVTNIAVFEFKSRHTKLGIAIDEFYADHAILVPRLVESLPYKFFFFSSVDALIHACESFLSPRATPYTEMFSSAAIEKILGGYQKIALNGAESRIAVIEDILVASNMAGIAFGNAGVGAVHALSYPIGGLFHVAHGEANYTFFLEVFKTYFRKKPQGKIQRLNQIFAAELGLTENADVYAALKDLLELLLPIKPLRQYGVPEAQIEEIADGVIANQQRLLVNNYVPLTRPEIIAIYQNLY